MTGVPDAPPPTGIVMDFDRPARIGIAEAVLCPGKTTAQLEEILRLAGERVTPLLLTRLESAHLDAIAPQYRERLDYDPLSRTALFGDVAPPTKAPEVAIVTGGSSDLSVAREALRTLAFHGVAGEVMADLGVAGLWRLTSRLDTLRRFPVIIAVAGMEAALPTVLAGLVGGVVIAVPASTGYGVSAGGLAALNSCLASCAPGLATLNIDNGYGAACLALRVLRLAPDR